MTSKTKFLNQLLVNLLARITDIVF